MNDGAKMKKSRTLWLIFLLLLYPATAEEVAAAASASDDIGGGKIQIETESLEVTFGAAFSVTCEVKNGTWSFNGGRELPEDASVSEVVESGGDEGAVSSRLDVPAANLDNVGEYRDGQFQWHFHKWKTEWAIAKKTGHQDCYDR